MIKTTEYRHKFNGLNGVKCGYHSLSGEPIKVGLSWDTITCPDCLKHKQSWEPDTQDIDTRGD